MRGGTAKVQMSHKEESPSRMKNDKQDRTALCQKLDMCINPLKPKEHPQDGLLNIVTGEVILDSGTNAENSLKISRNQQKEFEKNWPESFYKPLRRETKPIAADRKSIDIGDQKVIDVGVFYARALTLHASRRPGNLTIDTMLATELSPVATSMFTDYGNMRTTQKSHLKNELAVEK